jgi:hypothetical protein
VLCLFTWLFYQRDINAYCPELGNMLKLDKTYLLWVQVAEELGNITYIILGF